MPSRFYIFPLFFLLVISALALFFPWAAVFQSHKLPALIALFFFLAIPAVGYAYLWRFNYLHWPRSTPSDSPPPPGPTPPQK